MFQKNLNSGRGKKESFEDGVVMKRRAREGETERDSRFLMNLVESLIYILIYFSVILAEEIFKIN